MKCIWVPFELNVISKLTKNFGVDACGEEYVPGDTREMHVGPIVRVDTFAHNLGRLRARALKHPTIFWLIDSNYF